MGVDICYHLIEEVTIIVSGFKVYQNQQSYAPKEYDTDPKFLQLNQNLTIISNGLVCTHDLGDLASSILRKNVILHTVGKNYQEYGKIPLTLSTAILKSQRGPCKLETSQPILYIVTRMLCWDDKNQQSTKMRQDLSKFCQFIIFRISFLIVVLYGSL